MAATYSRAGIVFRTAIEKSQYEHRRWQKGTWRERCTGAIYSSISSSFFSEPLRCHPERRARSARSEGPQQQVPSLRSGQALRACGAQQQVLRACGAQDDKRALPYKGEEVGGPLLQPEPHPRLLPHDPPQLQVRQRRNDAPYSARPRDHQLVNMLQLRAERIPERALYGLDMGRWLS